MIVMKLSIYKVSEIHIKQLTSVIVLYCAQQYIYGFLRYLDVVAVFSLAKRYNQTSISLRVFSDLKKLIFSDP